MNSEQYDPLFKAFEEPAKEYLTKLSQKLADVHGRHVTPIELINNDVDRGYGFLINNNRQLFVDLMLTDGDEHGFHGVGLTVNCSIMASGQVWSYGNYTHKVGAKDLTEVVRRMSLMDIDRVANDIHAEWLSIESQQDAPGQAQG